MFIFLLLSFFTSAQTAPNSIGGSEELFTGVNLDFTVGQLDHLNFSVYSAAVFEGIQNPKTETNLEFNNSFSCLNETIVLLTDECGGIISSQIFTMPASNGLLVYSHTSNIPSSIPEGSIFGTDTVYGEGNWMYGIYNLFPDEKGLHQLLCWGTFTTEDKIDPVFVGDTTGLTDDLSMVWDESRFQQFGTYKEIYYSAWEDSLNPLETTFRPGLWSCY
ncbi:MAG: hypothetical protein RJA52_1202, partial [Bacteroidota bacterium]